jgi:hypothetical protein
VIILISAKDLNVWLGLEIESPETDDKLLLLVKRVTIDFKNYAKSRGTEIIESEYENLSSAAIAYGEYLYRRVTGSIKEVDLDVSISFGEAQYVFPPSVESALDLFVRTKINVKDIEVECQVV